MIQIRDLRSAIQIYDPDSGITIGNAVYDPNLDITIRKSDLRSRFGNYDPNSGFYNPNRTKYDPSTILPTLTVAPLRDDILYFCKLRM